jgi:hypothetical protein
MAHRLIVRSSVCGAVVLVVGVVACDAVETTGGDLITFDAYAAGPADINGGQPCLVGDAGELVTGAPVAQTASVYDPTTRQTYNYQVTLTSALFQIGAVYLIQGLYNNNSSNSMCIVPSDIYIGQVPGGIPMMSVYGPPGINLLCPNPTEFSIVGNGTSGTAGTAQIWLTGGQHSCIIEPEGGTIEAGTTVCNASSPDINAMMDPTPIVQLTGYVCPPGVSPGHSVQSGPSCSANSKGALNFTGAVTIQEANRGLSSMPADPGNNPICIQRIVDILSLDLPLYQGGNLYVRTDPRGWFGGVDFLNNAPCPIGAASGTVCGGYCCGLQQVSEAMGEMPAMYQIPDAAASVIGNQLYNGIVGGTLPSGASIYSLTFTGGEPE